MQKQFYFLAPVEVVKVTSQNLEEVAEWCGGKVAKAESRKVPGRMDSYVWVPTPKSSQISWAFPGMYITRRIVANMKGEIKDTWAVFRRDYFEKNYFDTPREALEETWEKKFNMDSDARQIDAKKSTPTVINVVAESAVGAAEYLKSMASLTEKTTSE